MSSKVSRSATAPISGPVVDVTDSIVVTQQHATKQPQLVIIRQNSLSQESISKNGIQKKVHVVVKNQPFLIQVGLLSSFVVDGQTVDFSRFPLEARLLYDNENLKEVDFVKLKPMDFKTHVNERGDQVTAEIRVKVLTSQLEDMFFRIRLSATHPITKNRIDQLSIISEPIKVVSKPEQIKKKKTPPTPTNPLTASIQKASKNNSNSNGSTSPPQQKRDVNEILNEALERIEQIANQHAILLNQIASTTQFHQLSIVQLLSVDTTNGIQNLSQQSQFQNQNQFNQNPFFQNQNQSLSVINSNQNSNPNNNSLMNPPMTPKEENKKRKEIDIPESPFEQAFRTFMLSYNRITVDERPSKVRRAMNQTSAKDAEVFLDLLDRCQAEAQAPKRRKSKNILDSNGSTLGSGPGCSCEDCSFKKELERIDEFYNEFLSTPSGDSFPAT